MSAGWRRWSTEQRVLWGDRAREEKLRANLAKAQLNAFFLSFVKVYKSLLTLTWAKSAVISK